ncbi:MAG: CBS domain-containing protein, partial [Aequorivita vladivostokensis]|nr:CBS domain-containing protein [Aequorivita vladivostokensis]
MGIKSFIGRRAKPIKKVSSEKVKVSDYMTRNLVTFKPEQSILEVMEVLLKKRISGGPVVNDKNELVGIISEGDCLKELSDARYHNHPMEDVKVEHHMIKNVDT